MHMGVICHVYRRVLLMGGLNHYMGALLQIQIYPQLSPASISAIFLRVAGFSGNFLLRQGWYNEGTVITLGGVLTPLALPGVHPAASLQTITAIRLLSPQVCTYGFRCRLSAGAGTGRVLYAPRLQFVATLVPALVLLVVRRQRGGLPHQKVGNTGVDDREEVGK